MPRHPGFADSVNLTISLCLTYVLCISCVRMWIRKGAFGVDDVVTGIATLVSFGHTAADYLALANGLGQPWTGIVGDEKISSLNAVSLLHRGTPVDLNADFLQGIDRGRCLMGRCTLFIKMRHDMLPQSNHEDAYSACPLSPLKCDHSHYWHCIALGHHHRLPYSKRVLLGF
jgi:hypothetical protein